MTDFIRTVDGDLLPTHQIALISENSRGFYAVMLNDSTYPLVTADLPPTGRVIPNTAGIQVLELILDADTGSLLLSVVPVVGWAVSGDPDSLIGSPVCLSELTGRFPFAYLLPGGNVFSPDYGNFASPEEFANQLVLDGELMG